MKNLTPRAAPTLILASTSPYRAESLRRLGLDFGQLDPEVDETPRPTEPPNERALRLSKAKAQSKATGKAQSAVNYDISPATVVIGSDQTGECAGQLLRKPGSDSAAIEMLTQLQGETALFHSGIAVYQKQSNTLLSSTVTTEVKFRKFTRAQLQRYVSIDKTSQCAGAFKVEQLGIALFEYVRSDDPSALVGLPLIALVSHLIQLGLDPIPLQTPLSSAQ